MYLKYFTALHKLHLLRKYVFCSLSPEYILHLLQERLIIVVQFHQICQTGNICSKGSRAICCENNSISFLCERCHLVIKATLLWSSFSFILRKYTWGIKCLGWYVFSGLVLKCEIFVLLTILIWSELCWQFFFHIRSLFWKVVLLCVYSKEKFIICKWVRSSKKMLI